MPSDEPIYTKLHPHQQLQSRKIDPNIKIQFLTFCVALCPTSQNNKDHKHIVLSFFSTLAVINKLPILKTEKYAVSAPPCHPVFPAHRPCSVRWTLIERNSIFTLLYHSQELLCTSRQRGLTAQMKRRQGGKDQLIPVFSVRRSEKAIS